MPHAPRIRLRFGLKLFLSHFVTVVPVPGSMGALEYLHAIGRLMQHLRSRLQNSAALLSQSIDARELDAVRTPADIRLEAYRNTMGSLSRLRRSNPDSAFLYSHIEEMP